MHSARLLIGLGVTSLLCLSAATARAEVTLGDLRASNGVSPPRTDLFVDGDTLVLSASASSREGVLRVEAELEGATVELAAVGGGSYQGTFDISDVAPGRHDLTIRAYDRLGDASTVERTLHKHPPPILWLSSPRSQRVIAGNTPLDARCIATEPYECRVLCMNVRSATRSETVCRTRDASTRPGTLYLLARPSRAFAAGEVLTVTLTGDVGVGTEIQPSVVSPIYVETSPKLVAVQAAPGVILDFDATRILFIHEGYQIGIVDRATREVAWISAMLPDPAGSVPSYGALTPSGAVIQSATGRIFVWRDGVWRKIAHGRLDAVNGDRLVWTMNNDRWGYVHSIPEGTNSSIWNRPDSSSPFQADLSASGDVYWGTYDEPWIRHLGVRRLGSHPGNLQRPITDGTNVAGRWWDGDTSSSYLYTAEGEEVFLGDSISGNSAGLLLHAGYAGFLKSDGAVNQVWLRTPDGEQHQLSSFATSSLFDQQRLRVGHDGISDDGEVLFLNGGKRYIGRPGAEPEEISSDLGHGRWFDGSFHVTLGDTLFRVASKGGAAAGFAARSEALRDDLAEVDGLQRFVSMPMDLEAEAPALALHHLEPDALPSLSDEEPSADLAGDELGEDLPAGVGCSAAGAAGSRGGAAAFAAALAGLALARRGRRRSAG
ncbi:hypothetical protein SOCE26_004750 [Sorangium cellulosum]|uniref:Secreted protein n=1 Tax=Sorangium cellulosum TaxID=56 RepID=A0A2L0EIG1_SORCE|nr:hypothetical protein [Sorangium cellulosum]AUX39093.1 hypothetical protein SOCE26_004750 [Sorangium cellulosum]